MQLNEITPSHRRLLRELANRISNRLEAEFAEPPAGDGASVGIVLHEGGRRVAIEIPASLLERAAADVTAREEMRVRIKGRRDRMLFRERPRPLPKRIAIAPIPGSMNLGFRGGGNFRGRR
jgi:hypothetical protein